jgi:hypothetical protein
LGQEKEKNMAQPERKRKSISFADLQASSNDDEIKDWLDGQEIIKLDASVKTLDLRPVGPIIPLGRHWPKSIKSGSTCPPLYCPKFNMQTQKFDLSNVCHMHDDFDDRANKILVFACIVRQWQVGKKAKQNPVGIMVLPGGMQKQLIELVGINKADLSDYEKGCDIRVTFDKDAAGPQKWSVNRTDRTKVTDEEREYDIPDLDALAPDFENPEYTETYLKGMRTKMAKWGYYVKPLNNGKSGWEAFRKVAEGEPYTKFPELTGDVTDSDVSEPHRNDVPVAAAVSRRPVADSDMPPRSRPVDTGAARAAKAAPAKVAEDVASDDEDAPAASLAGIEDDEDAPFDADDATPVVKAAPAAKPAPAAAPKAAAKAPPKSSAGPEEHEVWTQKYSIKWLASADGTDKPECIGTFAGAPKCRNCPLKSECLTA